MILLTATITTVSAYDFSAVSNGQRLYYHILSKTEPYTVEITIEDNDLVYSNYPKGNIVIPETVEFDAITYKVIGIGAYAFYKCDSIITVLLNNNINYISYAAFYECTALESVDLPQWVERIDECAFESCSKIEEVYIPNSVKHIGSFAFANCIQLKAFTVDEESKYFKSVDGVLYSYNLDTLLIYPTHKTGQVTLVDSLVYIQTGAFYECTQLEGTLKMPLSLRVIGDDAFYGCKNLNFVLNNGLKSIGAWAFTNCISFTGVLKLPNTITFLYDNCFSDCKGLIAVIIPDSITVINLGSFSGCENLETIRFNKKEVYIKQFAFMECYKLKKVEIPNSVKEIEIQAFWNCFDLTSVIIGDSVKTIKFGAFLSCEDLKTVVFGKSIQSIGVSAFSNIYGLQEMYIKAVIPPKITNNTFENISKTIPVYVPCGSKMFYEEDTIWNQFTNFIEVDYTYQITVNTGDAMKGSVEAGNVDCVTSQAVIKAIPAYGCEFTQWSDGSTENPRTIIVTKDTSITANFILQSGYYQITVLSNDSSLGEVTGTGIYAANSSITLTADCLNEYYFKFSHWSDGSTDVTRTITVTQDSILTAFFYDITSIPKINSESMLRAYPNPATNQLTLDNGESVIKEVVVFDITGRQVKRIISNEFQTTIDVSNLPTGMYIAKINTDQGLLTRKVQVVR